MRSSMHIFLIRVASKRVNHELSHFKNYLFSAMTSLSMFCPKEYSHLFELLHIVNYLFFAWFTDEKCKCWMII